MGFLFFFTCLNLSADLLRLPLWAMGRGGIAANAASALAGRSAFLCIAGLAVALSAYAIVEASRIEVVRVRVVTDRLPASVPSLRIAQITDLHLGLIHRNGKAREVAAIVARERPDIFVSTGDLVDGQLDGVAELAEILRGIPAPRGKFAVLGNHEYYAGIGRAIAFTRKSGFTLLRDESVTIDDAVRIAGVDDPAGARFGRTGGTSEAALLGNRPDGRFTLLLKHRPQLDPATGGKFDLQLSGHTHHGQIFPFRLLTRLVYPPPRGEPPRPGGRDPAREPGHGNVGAPDAVPRPPGDHHRGHRAFHPGGSRMTPGRLAPSDRAAGVQLPIIPIVAGWIAETPGTISLGQGVVHYGPPPAALAAIPEFLATVPHHQYIPDAGLPELRKAFEGKLRAENGIDAPFERRIYVTAGANQAFLNAVLAICDPGDEVILLSPYYFNHEMAITLASAVPVPVPVDERLQPDLPAIAAAITERTRAIVTVSPNNPTGAVYPRETLAAIHRLCAERGIYHVSDEAYEYFTYDGARHFSPGSLGGEHVISLYSLSKAYGMASWRVGFLVAPEHLHRDLMKIQDTVVVSGPAISQFVGLRAMREGRGYCAAHLPSLARVRKEVLARLSAVPRAAWRFPPRRAPSTCS